MAKYKNDNKTAKETARKQLTIKLVEAGSKLLTKLEQEVLTQVLINEKSFAEIGDYRQLTASRVRQIFEKGIRRLSGFINNIDERVTKYTEVIEKFEAMELKLGEYLQKEQAETKEKDLFASFPPETQTLLKTKIVDTELSARVKNTCEKGNVWGDSVKTVYDLIRVGKKDFLKFRNCGKKSIDEIEDFFRKHNLSWEMLE